MKIILEEHEYEASLIKDVLWEGAFQNVDNFVSVKYVGYFYNTTLKDCVFILPKVLMDGDEEDTRSEKVFGKYRPEDIIDLDKAEIDDKHRKFLYQFAVWIYRAINVYRNQVKDDPQKRKLILHKFVPMMGHGRVSRRSHTLLDIIIALLDFNRENEDFFTFTAKNLHSGQNRINWTRTIARTPCYLSDGMPFYPSPVNKKKVVNFDEELFVIFYSILNYIRAEYGFKSNIRLGYELISEKAFKRYLKGYGRRRLQEIKYKYFSDRALRLWELCYAFFEMSYEINLSVDKQEYLLAKNFYVVFEAMIDELIGDSRDKIPAGLKDQLDGKRVDHMYEDQNLTNDDEKDKRVFYIGDSKYYKLQNSLGPEAVYKQFTYARNVIQYNLDLFLDGPSSGENGRAYRDEVTEGYDIIPNFFISGTVDDDLSYADDLTETSKPKKTFISRQFDNRLFDRDTLLIAHYDVNFLYVLSLYARDSASEKADWQKKVRTLFRGKIQEMLSEKFEFYAMTPRGDVPTGDFLREHFQDLLGKVYTPYDGVAKTKLGDHVYYSLALEKPISEVDVLQLPVGKQEAARKRNERIDQEKENILSIVSQGFKFVQCKLGTDPSTVLEPESPVIALPRVDDVLPSYPRESIKDSWVLIGCVKNAEHREWIFKTIPKFKRDAIYNVRLDKSRDGAMNRSELKAKRPKFVVMYDLATPGQYLVYRVRNNAIIKQERMRLAGYQNPNGDYFCFILDERVSLGTLDIATMLERRKTELGEKFRIGAPFCIQGKDLL